MTENSHHSTLKEQLIDRIRRIDDDVLLQQCIDQLSKATDGHPEKQDDDGLQTVTIASQLRQQHSDKQQLVDQAKNQLGQAPSTPPTPPPTSTPPSSHRLSRSIIIAMLAILIIAGVFWMLKAKGPNEDDKRELVTTAERYETFSVGNVTFNMVYVEGGTFMMGGNKNESDECHSDELPAHQVTLSSYMIGETEVTEGLWKAVMGSAPLPNDGDDHPAKKVSWNDCQQFISQLRQLTGRPFCLPTEAQWEFAARGGNKSHNYKFAGSNDLEQVGWYSDNAWDKGKGHPDFGSHAVGTKDPNELGLYDMSGNVWEWCQDSFHHYTEEPQTDPQGEEDNIHSSRVNRGGSWDYIATSSRTTNRRNRTPDFRNFNLGLRLALPAE